MNAEKSPCRLFVYLARTAPVGVVLRRGPSAWSRLSVWRTDTDQVEHGQWLRGRVYERRCDVSADGSLFAYFTFKATGGPDVKTDSWAAISRPPDFTALALWAIGTTYFAGGFFNTDGSLWMSGRADAPDIGGVPASLRVAKDAPAFIDQTREWTDRTVHFNRLLRGGWTPGPPLDGAATVLDVTWQRQEPGGASTLMMADVKDADSLSYGGRLQTEYALLSGDGAMQPLGRATWADFDHGGRLIVAQDGRLCEWTARGGLRAIADFNDQTP